MDRHFPGQSPRRRIPIEQQREIRENQKKFDETQDSLFSVLYNSPDREKRVHPLNQMYHDSNRVKSNLQKEVIKLKYPRDLCIFKDDPQVQQILNARKMAQRRRLTSMNEIKKQMKIPPKLVLPISRVEYKNAAKSARPVDTKKIFEEEQVHIISSGLNNFAKSTNVFDTSGNLKSNFENQNAYVDISTNEDLNDLPNDNEIANEFLHFYDDADFDIGVIDKANELIRKNGKLNGLSLFCTPDFKTIWAPCTITKINNDLITIKFDKDINSDSNAISQTFYNNEQYSENIAEKEVHRISVMFDFEDQDRFRKRRETAKKIRKALDTECRVQIKIIKLSKEIKEPSNPSLLVDSLKYIDEKDRSSPMLNQLLIELSESFILAEAKVLYLQNWNDPFQRKQLEKENLGPISVFFPNLTSPGHLNQTLIDSIILPDHNVMLEIIGWINDFNDQDHLKEMFQTLNKYQELKHFFEEIQFNMQTLISYAQGQMYRKLYNLTYDIIEGKTPDKQRLISKMVDTRFATVLSNQIAKILNDIKFYLFNKEIKFKVLANENLTSEEPSLNDFLNIGKNKIKEIYKTFDNNPVMRINEHEIDIPNTVKTDMMDRSYSNTIQFWTETLKTDFLELHNLFEKIHKIISKIPENPFEQLIDVLPKDFYAVLIKGEEPLVKRNEINLDKIKQSLKDATDAIHELNSCYRSNISLSMINADLSSFFKKINQNYLHYHDYVMKYLSIFGDHELQNLIELILSLHGKMSAPTNHVEQWHEKHDLIEHIRTNFNLLNDSLDFELSLIDFFSEFLYQSNQNYSNIYEAKIKLFNFFKSIPNYELQLNEEKTNITKEHIVNKEQLKSQINQFLYDIYEFHFIKVEQANSQNILEIAEKLNLKRKEFDELKTISNTYKTRDNILGLDITDYPTIQEIEFNMSIFEPIWKISKSYCTTVENWLSSNFKELNVNKITNYFQDCGNILKNLDEVSHSIFDNNQQNPFILNIRKFIIEHPETQNDLKENKNYQMKEYPLQSSIQYLINKNIEMTDHIPILRELGNPFLRSRHWDKILEVLHYGFDPNEGTTWYWLIESNIEKHLLLISSISHAASKEFEIEKSLRQMCDELTAISLKTKNHNGVMKLDDPSSALEMISNHRKKMQEIFIPPYVQPFISKITDYELLANSFKQIIKQTLEAQEKIEELQPAMESDDIKSQAPELSSTFKEKVSQFNDFTQNFKLNISFHSIVSNQHYVEISKELNVGLDAVKQDMKEVLEKKRSLFPRFRFLSDSQLVSFIANSRTPSQVKGLFSLMYPAIKEALFDDEQFCPGFISFDNEIFQFKDKVWVNPNSIEKWLLIFDKQISETMKFDLQKLMNQPLADIDKIALQYPSQVVVLYIQIIFTSIVEKAFSTIENVLENKKEQTFLDSFNNIINTIDIQINLLQKSLKSYYKPQTSNLLLILNDKRDLITKIIIKHLGTPKSILWISTPKYYADEEINITVSIGDVTFDYGFDYIGSSTFPLFGDSKSIFNSLSLLIHSGYIPLLCGPRVIRKTNMVFNFAHIIGKQPFVFPCVSHSSFDKMHQILNNVSLINSFLVIKDIFLLKQDVLNELNAYLLSIRNSRDHNCSIFATTSIKFENHVFFVGENYRVAFRPILLNDINVHYVLKSIFLSHGIPDNEYISNKIETLISLIERSLYPPLSSSLTPSVIIKVIREKPFDIDNLNSEQANIYLENQIYNRLIAYFSRVFGYDDLAKIQHLVNKVLIHNDNDIPTQISPSKFNSLDYLLRSLKLYTGVIVYGEPLAGKTTLINRAKNIQNAELIFINPLAIDFKELYGDNSSGLLGYYIQNAQDDKETWIVFDGICEDSWMDILMLAFSEPKRLSFGDGSMLNLPNSIRFIFETSNLSFASPSTLSLCATTYISKEESPFEVRLESFLKEEIQSNSNLIDPISNKIIGSEMKSNILTDKIRDFSITFVPKIFDFISNKNMEHILTPLHFLNNYFSLLKSSIFDYYCVDPTDSLKQKHSASELVSDSIHLAMFSLYWTFVSPFEESDRRKLDGLIKSIIESSSYKGIFHFNNNSLGELFFNTDTHCWEEWNKGLSSILFFSNESTDKTFDEQLTEIIPMHLLISESTLYPTLYISKILISQDINIMLTGSPDVDKAILSDLCFQSPYATKNLSHTTYLFQKNGTHKLLRSMIKTILPDTRSFSLRKPYLSLIDFNTSESSSAGELIRFIAEHKFFYNTKSFVKEMTSSLRFFITTDEKEINQRLSHHTFVIKIDAPDSSAKIDMITKSIRVLWNLNENASVIASSLLALLNQSKKIFTFNFKHLFHLIQRVASVSQEKSHEFLSEALSHECIRVFYDPTHSNQILSQINQMMKHLSKVIGGKYLNAFEISDKKILANINSNSFEEYSIENADQVLSQSSNDANEEDEIKFKNSKKLSKNKSLKFVTSSTISMQKLGLLNADPLLKMDTLRLSRILSLPRMHASILTNLEFIPLQLLQGCKELIDGNIHVFQKKSYLSSSSYDLMRYFHDAFLKGGQQKKHQFLLVEVEKLNNEEKLLMMSLLHDHNVFNLFQRGEMLKILTSMHRKGSEDSFGEATLEFVSNYNELVSEFVNNCATYFHWVLVDQSPLTCPEFIEYSAPYQPFFATDIALKTYIIKEFSNKITQSDIIINIEPERFEALLTAVRLDPLFQNIPYTKSYIYSLSFLNIFIKEYNQLCEEIKFRKKDFIEIQQCSDKLATYLKETNNNLMNMENDLLILTKQIEESMKQIEHLNEITDNQKIELEKEAQNLYQQETSAAAMKKEVEIDISNSKNALNESAQELKSLSPRDLAVIKGMNHPPRGVLLVIRALLFVLGIDRNVKAFETNEELEQKFSRAKRVLNDPSFVSNLIDITQSNPLNSSEVEKLTIICNDENFDPSVIERSSSAAKSICKYIRSLIPYYNAIFVLKAKTKEMETIQNNISSLRSKHNEAMERLNAANRESINLQNRQADIIKSKVSTEESLKEQREKIRQCSELYEMIEPLFSEWGKQKQKFEIFTSIASVQFIMKMFYHNWGSPLSNIKRIEFLQKLQNIMKSLSIEISPLIKYSKNKLINKNFPNVASNLNEVDEIKALRLAFINQKNYIAYYKSRFKYPVSEGWLENMLFLTSYMKKHNWSIVEGLSLCPISYLRQICQTSKFVFISALSSSFDEEFIQAIKNNSFVLLFDFDFNSPKSIVIKTQKSILKNKELKYQTVKNNEYFDETISIDPNFSVLFDAKSIENLRVVKLELGYIKLGFSIDDVKQRIQFSLFEATNLELSDQIKRIESTILSKEHDLSQTQIKLKEFMLEANEKIFTDTDLQQKFTKIIREIKILRQEIESNEKEHSNIMKNMDDCSQMADEIISLIYQPEKISYYIWRIFDSCISELQSFDFEKLKLLIITKIVSEFGISKSFPILFDLPKLCTEYNICIYNNPFDNIIQFIEEKWPSSLFNYQCPSSLLSLSSFHRPIVLHAQKSFWLADVFLHYLMLNENLKYDIVSPNDSLKSVLHGLISDKIIITFCSSTNEMKTIIQSISCVLSSQYASPNFAFFVIITSNFISSEHAYILDAFPILNLCNHVNLGQPLNYGATCGSSLQSLLKIFKNGLSIISMLSLFDSSCNIYNKVVHDGFHYSFCNSVVSIGFISRNISIGAEQLGKYLIKYLYATEFKTDKKQFKQIWKTLFPSNDLDQKQPEENNQDKNSIIQKILNLPKNSSLLTSEVISKLPFSFDFDSFGFSKVLSSYFQQKHFRNISNALKMKENEQYDNIIYESKLLKEIENLNSSNFWNIEKRLAKMHIISILARSENPTPEISKRINHLLTVSPKSTSVDISLLFDPVGFLKIMKIEYSIQTNISISNIILCLTKPTGNSSGQIFSNLFSIGASYDDNVGCFQKHQGMQKLPELMIFPQSIEEFEAHSDNTFKSYNVNLYYSGQIVFEIMIPCDFVLNNNSVFIQIPEIDEIE